MTKPFNGLRSNHALSPPMPDAPPLGDRLSGHVQRIAVDAATGKRKGFGFIRTEHGVDYFFHATDVQGTPFNQIREGHAATFTPTETPKGLKAIEVMVETTRRTT